jgi:ABC-type amino acid transport substrate-binding protein
MTRGLFCLCLFLACLTARAQTPAPSPSPAPLRVAVAGSPPFVMTAKNGQLEGFSIELWQSVAASNGWPAGSFQRFETMDAAIDALADGRCDIVVGDTSITSEREKRVEFSQPFYRAGLQIMVNEEHGHLAKVFARLCAPEHLRVLGGVFLGVILATFVVAAFERRHNPDFPQTRGAGLAESFYYVMGLVLGKSSYKGFSGVLGRLVLVGWMVASLFVVVYVQSIFSASMTADLLQGHIHGPEDLPSKSIGLVTGSQSETYARLHNLDYSAFPTLDAAVDDLLKHKVQCVVGDAPVVQYFDFMNPRLPVREVGPVFDPVNYGFAVPQSSPLREPINLQLLLLFEAGYFDKLGAKYFGMSYQK